MHSVVSSELLVLLVGSGEDKGDIIAANDMGSIGSFTSLESLLKVVTSSDQNEQIERDQRILIQDVNLL